MSNESVSDESMSNDNRHFKRQPLSYKATIMAEGEAPCPCVVRDASETGARLHILSAQDLPDGFKLMLSAGEGPTRDCRVVWRDGDKIGVRFEGRPR